MKWRGGGGQQRGGSGETRTGRPAWRIVVLRFHFNLEPPAAARAQLSRCVCARGFGDWMQHADNKRPLRSNAERCALVSCPLSELLGSPR